MNLPELQLYKKHTPREQMILGNGRLSFFAGFLWLTFFLLCIRTVKKTLNVTLRTACLYFLHANSIRAKGKFDNAGITGGAVNCGSCPIDGCGAFQFAYAFS